MLSLICAIVSPVPPTLLAIVNPNDGTAWRQDGAMVECPLTKAYLEERGHERYPGWKPTERLFVFRTGLDKDRWVSADIPAAEWNEWPLAFFCDRLKDDGLVVLSQVAKPEAETADFDLQYAIGPMRQLIDLRLRKGKAEIVEGAEYAPRFFSSCSDIEAGWPESYRSWMRREWSFSGTTQVAFGYRLPSGKESLISRGAYGLTALRSTAQAAGASVTAASFRCVSQRPASTASLSMRRRAEGCPFVSCRSTLCPAASLESERIPPDSEQGRLGVRRPPLDPNPALR